MASLWAAPAAADKDDTLNVTVRAAKQYDDNIFRLAGGVDPTPLVGQSSRGDQIETSAVGVSFKKPYSMQQLEANAERVCYRYDRYGFLNSNVNNGSVAWRWHFLPAISGNLIATTSQALAGFADYRTFNQPNLRTTTRKRFDADWQVAGGWHLVGGVEQTHYRNSQAFTQDDSTRVTAQDIGVRYLFRSGASVGVTATQSNGQYSRTVDPLQQLDSGYREHRNLVRLSWPVTGKSTLEGELGRVSRTNDNFASRDYSANVGAVKWGWTPTGKLALQMSLRRNVASWTDLTSSYYVEDTLSVAPVWQVSAKVKASLQLDRKERDFRAPVTTAPFVPRRDRQNAAQLAVEWVPMRFLTVTGYVANERRGSTVSGFDYVSKSFGATVQLTF